MIEQDLAKKVLAVTVGKGADYADLFVERAVYNLVLSDDRKLRTDLYAEHGVGIRVVIGDKTCYAIGDSFEEAALLRLAAYVRDAAGDAGKQTGVIDLRRQMTRWHYPFAIPAAPAATETKVDIVKRGEEAAWSTPHCSQATIRYRDHQRDIFLASTLNDSILTQTLGLTEFAVMVILDRNGTRESGILARSFYQGLEALTGENSPEAMASKAAKIAATALDARDCPRGEMPVIFARGENGILFHESCGHGMEADLVEKGSVFGGLIGQAVASPLVSLVDDGTLAGYPGSFEFDDEGTPSQRTVLIDRGVLQMYLHSSLTARKAHAALTGSARRESYKYPPIPRMRNTFILAGNSDPEEIIRDTKRGLYAVDAGGGGQVNVITGEFITSVKLGYMIEDGQLTYPVKGASIIGRGMDALRDIDMVGNDLEITHMGGRCGKGQQAPVGVGMPTVRVKSLNVGGTGDAFNGGGA
ncbi:MAG: TldD/PmbA family protein [candidate division Zixibacteria bacterium]|nr:TldD/PmbA family protein [candidate division Zixibacteria bacterium]